MLSGALAIRAAARIKKFNGVNRTWFAGAYLGNGFHEDGVLSGRRVADAINRLAPSASTELPELAELACA